MTQDTNPFAELSPVHVLVAQTVERCIGEIDTRLGPIDEHERHVLAVQLSGLLARWIGDVVTQTITGHRPYSEDKHLV